jgi:hypothetical protein
MEEVARTVQGVPNPKDPGVGKRGIAVPSEPAREYKHWNQLPNEIVEAYTGNHVARRGDRTA